MRRLVKEKANVVIVDVNNDRGNSLVKELGKTTLFVNADIISEGILPPFSSHASLVPPSSFLLVLFFLVVNLYNRTCQEASGKDY